MIEIVVYVPVFLYQYPQSKKKWNNEYKIYIFFTINSSETDALGSFGKLTRLEVLSGGKSVS